MDPGAGESSPAISQAVDGDRFDAGMEMEKAADGHPYLFKILKDAGMEIDDELAADINNEIARIKAEGVREAVTNKSSGGMNIINILQRVIKGAARGVGYVFIHSACACLGIILYLSILKESIRANRH